MLVKRNTEEKSRLEMPSRWQFLILLPFALLYSLFIVLGDWEKAEAGSGLQNGGRILLWMFLSYAALLFLCFIISQKEAILGRIPLLSQIPACRERAGKWYVYLIFFLLCLAGCLPYFLMYYPTWLSNDAVWQIEQALGWAPASNHHPWFHTMIIKFFFMAGYRIFGTYTEAMAFYTFWQIIIMSSVYAFFLYQLYKSGTRLLWLVAAAAFYAFLPINGLMSICMTKDEFFTAALLVFAWQGAKLAGRKEDVSGSDIRYGKEGRRVFRDKVCRLAGYFVSGLLVCLLRSNGVYVFLGTVFFLLLSKWMQGTAAKKEHSLRAAGRREFLAVFTCTAAVLLCYGVYHGPILKAMDVEPPDTIEALTMPTQHILCAYVKGGELTQEEAAMIGQVVPADQAASYYNPYLFDIFKAFVREAGNQEIIAEQKWDYFKLWLQVGLRNPLRYLEAEVKQTAGYWALDTSDYQYVVGEYYMVDNPFAVTTQRKLFTYQAEVGMYQFLMSFQDLYNKVWSLGLNTWIFFFCFACAAYRKKNVMIFVPFVMLLVTLLLAVPVYNVLRYVYALFMALPLLLGYSFRTDTVRNDETGTGGYAG